MLVIIIVKEGLKELSTFFILAFDDDIRIVRIVVEHTDSIVRFVCTNRSVLFSESETEMGFITTLDDIFEKIVFGIFMAFDILKNIVFVNIFINKHEIGVRTVTGQGLQGIIVVKVREARKIENAVSKITRFVKFVRKDEPQEMSAVGLFMIERML